MRSGDGHQGGIPPKLFEDRIERRRGRAADNPQSQVELSAHVLGIMSGERESHEGLGVDHGLGLDGGRTDFAEALIEFVRSLVEFSATDSGIWILRVIMTG